MRSFFKTFFVFILISTELHAHPMPNSVLLLDVNSNGVLAELQWPLKELQLAFPDEDIDINPNTLLQRKSQWLNDYLRSHLSVTDTNGTQWALVIKDEQISETQHAFTIGHSLTLLAGAIGWFSYLHNRLR